MVFLQKSAYATIGCVNVNRKRFTFREDLIKMDTKMEMNLHTKLASLRKQKGLTQTDLAEKLNVSRQAISKWEGGYAVPSTDNLKVLSDLSKRLFILFLKK